MLTLNMRNSLTKRSPPPLFRLPPRGNFSPCSDPPLLKSSFAGRIFLQSLLNTIGRTFTPRNFPPSSASGLEFHALVFFKRILFPPLIRTGHSKVLCPLGIFRFPRQANPSRVPSLCKRPPFYAAKFLTPLAFNHSSFPRPLLGVSPSFLSFLPMFVPSTYSPPDFTS